MSEYRSDLRAARERVEQLEALLIAQRRDCRKTPSTPLSIARVIGLCAVLVPILTIIVLATLFILYVRHPTPTVVELPPPPFQSQHQQWEGLGWHESGYPHATGPLPVKVGAVGGPSLIVGLAIDRRPTKPDEALYAVAIDRATWRTVWRAGPFPSMVTPDVNELHHVVVKDDRVVVTDATGGVHVLDATSGGQLFFHKLVHGGVACLDEDTRNVALTVEARFWSQPSMPRDLNGLLPTDINRYQATFLDPKTGKTRHAAQLPVCAEGNYCSKTKTGRIVDDLRVDCTDLDERARTPPSILEKHIEETWRSGTTARISVGRVDGARHAVGWDAATRTVAWEKVLSILHEDPPRASSRLVVLSKLDHGRFAHLSNAADGALHLLMLDAASGKTRFDVGIPHTSIGTRVHSMTIDHDDVFVVIDDELHVIDATTGLLRRRLESL